MSDERLPLSKAAYVVERLKEDLASGLVGPGDSLNQLRIASRYGVSATPVREALRMLEADGVVTYQAHKGATVTDLPRAEVEDLYIFRAAVEGLTATLAVERATPEQVSALQDLHEELQLSATHAPAEELAKLNREFHLAVMAIGSPFIADHVMRPLWERLMPPRESLWKDAKTVRGFIDAHDGIVRAIAARDAVAAEAQLRAHIFSSRGIRRANSSALRPGGPNADG